MCQLHFGTVKKWVCQGLGKVFKNTEHWHDLSPLRWFLHYEPHKQRHKLVQGLLSFPFWVCAVCWQLKCTLRLRMNHMARNKAQPSCNSCQSKTAAVAGSKLAGRAEAGIAKFLWHAVLCSPFLLMHWEAIIISCWWTVPTASPSLALQDASSMALSHLRNLACHSLWE